MFANLAPNSVSPHETGANITVSQGESLHRLVFDAYEAVASGEIKPFFVLGTVAGAMSNSEAMKFCVSHGSPAARQYDEVATFMHSFALVIRKGLKHLLQTWTSSIQEPRSRRS
jgi:hypothetical protein